MNRGDLNAAIRQAAESIRGAINGHPQGAVVAALAYAFVWVAHEAKVPGGLEAYHQMLDEAWNAWELTAWGNNRN